MASLYSRIGKPVAGYQPPPANPSARGFTTKSAPLPAPNLSFTSAGNPAGKRRSGLMGAAQGMPNQGYQPPGLSQGGGATPLARPPQSPPNPFGMQGGQQSPMGGGFAPAPAGSVRISDGSLSNYSGPTDAQGLPDLSNLPGGGAGRHGGNIRTPAQAAQKREEYLKDPRWRAAILARQEKLKNNPWQQPTGGGISGGQRPPPTMRR